MLKVLGRWTKSERPKTYFFGRLTFKKKTLPDLMTEAACMTAMREEHQGGGINVEKYL